jgi:hypothetical protein
MIVMFLRCVNTCQRDKVGVLIEKNFEWLASRNLVGVITILKFFPLLILAIALVTLMRTEYFKPMQTIVALALTQIVMTFSFNLFNAARFFLPDATTKVANSYWMLNARYTQYISLFFVDMLMIAMQMLLLVLMRNIELQVLVALGVYKNVENMTDREMLEEYDKLKKQSRKMQKRLRRQQNKIDKKNRDPRLSTASNESDAPSEESKTFGERMNLGNLHLINTRSSVSS